MPTRTPQLIYVTFSDGATRGFLSGKAALRYATKRGLQVVRISEARDAD